MTLEENGLPVALVVDDTLDNRRLFRIALETAGYQVMDANNGQRAHEMLIERPYHLMLLDLDMPVLNGRDLLKRLKDHPHQRPKHIIVATANTQMTTEIVMEMADYIIYKPFTIPELITMAKRLRAVNVD